MENTPKTFKELFANTGIEPTTDENGNTHYHFNAIRKKEHKEEPKQETLEEATERNYNEAGVNAYFNNGFIRGVKWQQDKNKYSDEDLRTAYFSGIKTTGEGWNGEYANGNNPSIEEEFQEEFQEWLKQFKNNLENK
jgi:hypothetical protein